MTKVITITNNKGGVGKTSTTLHLGDALVKRGKKVLLWDMDSQSNLTQRFTNSETIDVDLDAAMALRHRDIPLSDAILEFEMPIGTVHIIPSNKFSMANLEQDLAKKLAYDHLRTRLKPIVDLGYYDYILIDCLPTTGMVMINSLVMADYYLITSDTDKKSIDGSRTVHELVKDVIRRETLNPDIRFLGLLFIKYNPASKVLLDKAIYEGVIASGEDVFKTTIRDNVTIRESWVRQTDLYTYNPKSFGCEDYDNLTEEILEKTEKATIKTPALS